MRDCLLKVPYASSNEAITNSHPKKMKHILTPRTAKKRSMKYEIL